VKRRTFLAGVPPGLVGTAGCLVGYQNETGTGNGSESESEREDPPTEYPGIAEYGYPSTVCEEDLRPDAIPAIEDPAFAPDWSEVDIPEEYRAGGGLTDDRVVVGVERDDLARAYPLSVLARHEVVNDSLGGPVLVTYCPICRSGLVASRELDGGAATFGVTGLLWKPPDAYTAASEADGKVFGASESDPETGVRDSANLVMYDEPTGSRWSQVLAEAICGPKTGESLEILPSTVATWGEWRTEHPDTVVLLPPPFSGTLDPAKRAEG
jgi:hypothetical protein